LEKKDPSRKIPKPFKPRVKYLKKTNKRSGTSRDLGKKGWKKMRRYPNNG